MPHLTGKVAHLLGWTLLIGWTTGASALATDGGKPVASRNQDRLWRRTVDLVHDGDFQQAHKTIDRVTRGGALTDRVRQWLSEYETSQADRRLLDREDFDKYVGYAKARIEREEYNLALGWALAALDCTTNEKTFLNSGWLQDLTNVSLEAATKHREKSEWRDAWRLYSQLSSLFERQPHYQRLEHEVLTHLRLDSMFKKGAHWDERVEKVRWSDAKKALQFIGEYYVEPPDYKPITARGLEQLLLLTESKTAREEFNGLQDEDKVQEFKLRIQKHLDQVNQSPNVDRVECVQRFRRVVKSINRETINLPETLLVSELMRGALDPLDDFTTIIWPQDSKEFDKHTRGNFVGVGISIIKNRADEIEVVTPMDDAPAYRAGIQAGDIIAQVDGKPLDKDISINKVVQVITGPRGTMVTLTIRRGDQELEFDLKRSRVKIMSVKGVKRNENNPERWDHWLDEEMGIAYVRITNFQRNTVEDLLNTLSELQAGGMSGLILDLRGNPGGLLDSAWQMSSLFLERRDTVVSTKGRLKSEDNIFLAPHDGPYADLPLAVLVDKRSASASEIVSGAVRDNHAGTVIGERTFGKFSVQNLITLGRSGAKLKITTAKYYLPSGVSLHRDPTSETWGVEPEIPIRLTRWERFNMWQMQREANLLGPAKAKVVKKDDKDGKEENSKDKGDKDGDKDGDKLADAGDKDKDDKPKLPPLKQPDENNRPKRDPQREAALLFLRIMLFGDSFPTLAAAEQSENLNTGRP